MNRNCSVSNKNKKDTNNYKKVFGRNFSNQLKLYKKIIDINNIDNIKGNKKKISDNYIYEKIAEYIGYQDITCMNKWKKGKEIPGIEVILKLADFFGCTVDELVKDTDPYIELKQQLRQQGFSENLIQKLVEILKIKRMTQTHLFGNSKETPVINIPDFYTELVSGDVVNHIIKIFNGILSSFDDLTENELKQCKKVIQENKDKYISKYKDNYTLQLETLEVNLPSEVRENIVKYKDELDSLIKLNTSAYIMRLFNQILNKSEKSEFYNEN